MNDDYDSAATMAPSTCLQCRQPLPAGSRSYRRFCSSNCRRRHWDAVNPAEQDVSTGPPLYGRKGPRAHYHVYPFGRGYPGGTILVGHIANEPWFGTGCPPECPGHPGRDFEPKPMKAWRLP